MTLNSKRCLLYASKFNSISRTIRANFSVEGETLQKSFLRSVKSNISPIQTSSSFSDIQHSFTSSIGKVSSHKQSEHVKEQQASIKIDQQDYLNENQNYLKEFAPRICVIGVGGGGCNAVDNMISRGLVGVKFICANTDAQHLSRTTSDNKLQLGRDETHGLGCGANPEAGRRAALESKEEIEEYIGDAHMVFITAGMGGGTGTGAAPVVAEICMEKNILVVGVVTKPFSFEGRHRARLAEEGIKALESRVDTLIVIPNQNLFKIANANTTFTDAFGMADDVLLAGVKSITDLMVRPGLINLDFADVKSVMSGMGYALMGTGQATGEDRAVKAATDAMMNPLLGGDLSIKSAKGMLVNITGGADLTLYEIDAAAQKIISEVEDENANVIFGSSLDPSLQNSIRVSVIATGIDNPIPKPEKK